jgi:hypothetical protein
MDDDELLLVTSTIRCTNCMEKVHKRVRDAFVQFTMRRFDGWRREVLPSRSPEPMVPDHIALTIPQDLLSRAKDCQEQTDVYMRRHESVCNTPFIELAEVQRMVQSLGFPYDVTEPMTMGGISRLYRTSRPDSVVKVSLAVDKNGFGRYEKRGYEMLHDASIPAAKVLHVGISGRFLVLVIEKLYCSIGTIIRSSKLSDMDTIQQVIVGMKSVLGMLLYAGLVFIDLSPDNIMYDHTKKCLKLIDAQFVVSRSVLQQELGAFWSDNVDTISLAVRVLALGMLRSSDDNVTALSRIIAASLLEKKCPSQHSVLKWLKEDMPMLLTTSFGISKKMM